MDTTSREGDEEGEEGLLAQLGEAFASDRGGHQDRTKALETIQVRFLLCACRNIITIQLFCSRFEQQVLSFQVFLLHAGKVRSKK